MAPDPQTIFDSALTLPTPERVRLAEILLDSVSPSDEELLAEGWQDHTEAELVEELERRRAEIELGDVQPLPLSELKLDS